MLGKVTVLALSVFAAPLTSYAADMLVPAGALVTCTIAEPKLSSKTADVGDPVLCRVNRVELSGRSPIPYGSYLVGHFEDYRDPGHFVGKGWMELKFDRLVLPPDTEVGFSAKVVDVPKYGVDRQGRIHGNGHPVADTVEWLIPVLWPIDLINLPRRGPRPVLKAETRLTLKIMDDVEVPQPAAQLATAQPPALVQRAPIAYEAPEPAPVMRPTVQYVAPPAPMPMEELLVMRNGYGMVARDPWVDGYGRIRYTATNGAPVVLRMEQLDYAGTVEANRQRGVEFSLRQGGF